MPASLGKHLIFELDRGYTGLLKRRHRPSHVVDTAVSGVPVRNHRNRHHVTDEAGHRCHLIHGDKADVGFAQQRIGYPGPGEVDGGETLPFDQTGEQGVERARSYHR